MLVNMSCKSRTAIEMMLQHKRPLHDVCMNFNQKRWLLTSEANHKPCGIRSIHNEIQGQCQRGPQTSVLVRQFHSTKSVTFQMYVEFNCYDLQDVWFS